MQVRRWQHLINEGMKNKKIGLTVHMAFGHEAIAVAVSEAMKAGDQLVLTHRNVSYNLAREGALKPLYLEYQQKTTGLAAGKLGTMNLANPAKGLVYTSSILGNDMPVACGLALGHQLAKRDSLVIVLTGDGAMEEGTFYESLVLAKSQKLKVMFMVENNKYAMSSTIDERRCQIDIAQMAKAVDAPYLKLSGNWVADYAARLQQARQAILEQSGPMCVEVDLMNLNRHAGPTPGWPTDPMQIHFNNGLIVQESEYDPVFVLKQKMPAQQFTDFVNRVLAEKGDDVDG
jgi:TPP-dependent pyruvate/acetoin dehydrogenase alpha subunit